MDALDSNGNGDGNGTRRGFSEGLVLIFAESVLEKVLLMRLSRCAAR
jgi:hypothetical protein